MKDFYITKQEAIDLINQSGDNFKYHIHRIELGVFEKKSEDQIALRSIKVFIERITYE